MSGVDRAAELRARLARARLYLIATTAVARRPLVEAVALAIQGGVDVVQLREKTMAALPLLLLTEELQELCAARGVLFVVNDEVGLAVVRGTDGVHLGQEDMPVADARAELGPAPLIGVSTHSAAELDRAIADGADYVGVGSAFATATKGRDVPVLGGAAVAALAARAEAAGVPAFAIGGITRGNVRELAAVGARRVAVCAGILAAADPRPASQAIRRALG